MDRWSGGGRRMEAAQLLDLAERLLDASDLVGSRKFAERAMESEPLLDGADRVLAAADVLLAAQRRRINNHVDWYAVLQLEAPSSGGGRNLSDVRLQYRRLALLLGPVGHHHTLSAAEEAFKLVSDAWAVLSDPAKKELYDKELAIAAAAATHLAANGAAAGGRRGGEDAGARVSAEAGAQVDGGGSFWTACTNCFYVHEYERGCEDRSLLCANCRKAFLATELASPPPIVPGSDMYYCAWGLFPLGFPGGPGFGWPAAPNTGHGPEVRRDVAGKPWSQEFFPGFPPWWGAQRPAAMGGWVNAEYGNGESHGGFGSWGKRQRQGDVGASGNQGLSVANKEKAQGAAMSENASSKEMRKKVVAKRPKKQVGCGTSREVETTVDSLSKGGGYAGEPLAAKPDRGNNAQNVGCSRTVEISAEDLDLNFSIDIDATDNILSSLSTLPFLKDGEIVVVD